VYQDIGFLLIIYFDGYKKFERVMNKCIPLNLMERNTKKPISIRKS